MWLVGFHTLCGISIFYNTGFGKQKIHNLKQFQFLLLIGCLIVCCIQLTPVYDILPNGDR